MKSLNKPISIFIIAIFLLVGCSLKTIYNYSDWVLLWYLDDYFDLTAKQRKVIDDQFKGHLKWHKKEELLHYKTFLEQVKADAQDGLTSEDLILGFDTFEQFKNKIMARLSGDVASFLAGVKESQIDNLEEELESKLENLIERIEMDQDEYLENRVNNTIENITDWVGSLSEDQEKAITRLSRSFPIILEDHLNHRKKSNKKLVALLRSTKDSAIIEKKLIQWYIEQKDYYAPAYAQKRKINKDASIQMILEVEKMLTQKQREHFFNRIDEYINEILEISKNAT